MAIMATKKEGGNFDPVAEGTYAARLYSIVYIGTVEGYGGKLQEKVRLTFELPNETKEFQEGEGEKPFVLSQECTLSTGERANLRKIIEALIGTSLKDDEAKSFDIEQLLGYTCQVTVKHKEKKSGEGKFAVIDNFSQLMKGIEVPPQVNESVSIAQEDWTEETLSTLPDFLREKIESSQEYQFMQKTAENRDEEEANPDSVPF